MNFQWILNRARNIILQPKNEWPLIAQEPETIAGLYQRYILVLAALPAVAGLIKSTMLGYSVPFVGTVRLGFAAGISGMLVQYVLSLAMVFVLALIIDALAKSFDGEKNQVQALKVAAYAMTAGWLGGTLVIVPWLGMVLSLLGAIYALYLLYIGLPHTMRNPESKSLGYTVVTVIAAFILNLIIGVVVASVTGAGALGSMSNYSDNSAVEFDKDSPLSKWAGMAKQVEKASKKMEAAEKSGDASAQAKAAQDFLGAALSGGASKVTALEPAKLKTFLPETFAGMQRRSQRASREGAVGIQISSAKAEYDDQDQRNLSLDISDLGGVMGLSALASTMGMGSEEETDDGYERSYVENGRRYEEQWRQSDEYAKYSVIVANRFTVKLEGRGFSMAEIKSAFDELDISGLESLKEEGVVRE